MRAWRSFTDRMSFNSLALERARCLRSRIAALSFLSDLLPSNLSNSSTVDITHSPYSQESVDNSKRQDSGYVPDILVNRPWICYKLCKVVEVVQSEVGQF